MLLNAAVRSLGLFHEILTDSLTEIDYSFPDKLGQATRIERECVPTLFILEVISKKTESIYLWKCRVSPSFRDAARLLRLRRLLLFNSRHGILRSHSKKNNNLSYRHVDDGCFVDSNVRQDADMKSCE